MLDVYKDKQSLFYEEVKKSIENNKISHAYLIETNNLVEKDELILSFIKTLFCGSISLDSCNQCNICHLIDNHIYSDFIVIEPDGSWIKKEQILELKKKFQTTSYQNRPRIYWIKQAEKLNKSSANSLLKFLEEPDGNIIAVLDTSNRYQVIETVRSRCQIYSFINYEKRELPHNFELITNIIEVLEKREKKSIAYLPVILENELGNKEFWNETFGEMIYIYENAVRKKNNLQFFDYGQVLILLVEKNDISKLLNKISTLFDMIHNLDYNLNIAMMLDSFVIQFTGGD